MRYKAKIFVSLLIAADLWIVVAPIASADSMPNPTTTPEQAKLSCLSSVLLQVPLVSETIYMGETRMKTTCVTEQSEPESLASGSDLLFFDSEPTRVGRRRRCRDMSGLSLCLCGERVKPGDIESIKCQRTGCETVWVSNCVFLYVLS